MGNSSVNYFKSSFAWSGIAKILNAALKFVSIPLLLTYFGEDLFGVMALVVSTNAYMLLLNMGINTGAVKFFSQWISEKNYVLINRVAQTSLTVYVILGAINALILIILSFFGVELFNLSRENGESFRYLLLILAGASIVNWSTFVFNQLLISAEKIAFTQQVLTVRNLSNLALVFVTIGLKLSLYQYFFLDTLLNMLTIVPYIYLSKSLKLIQRIKLGFYWKEFNQVFKYSLAIFSMGIFQFMATQSRPLILGIFSEQGASIQTEYRIIEVFAMFVISIGGMAVSIFLPKASKMVHQNDRSGIENLAYKGTRMTSFIISALCFPIILNAESLINIYVGEAYQDLSVWLIIWISTIIFYLHNGPIASLVLATGKTKMLVASSAVSSVISIFVNATLANDLGVGSAVIGYLIYIILQMSFYYFYFNSKVLELNSFRVFKSFIIPVIIGCFTYSVFFLWDWDTSHSFLRIIISSFVWGSLFILIAILSGVLELGEVIGIITRNRK